MNKTHFCCPGSSEYWQIRATAFALIKVIGQDLSCLTDDDEAPYWQALQSARENPTVLEILRAQGRVVLLTPALGTIPGPPQPSAEELVASQFGLTLPIDLDAFTKKAYADEDWEIVSYLDHLKEGPSEFAPWSERIMTPDGIVRIVTESWDDEETRFYRRETYLNGELHDYDGKPAVRESSHHRIASEGYLDTDIEESYRHGQLADFISHDDDVVAAWSPGQREAFGASV
jgi:hypothetical protein